MLWIKAFHIFFMVSWYAGLLYLPRLFIYHAQTEDVPGRERFTVMERRLFAISSIGALGTIVLGLWLTAAYWWPAVAGAGWFHVKMLLVVALLAYHLYCRVLIGWLAQGRMPHGITFLKVFNEVPAVILIAVLVLVVVKPF